MRCSKCGVENAVGSRFCNQCATPLSRACPKCAHLNAPDAKFCAECAEPLTADVSKVTARTSSAPSVRVAPEQSDSAAADGERKTVTALFADIKGSTELEQDLDPEEARAIVDPALKLMIEAAHRYDGYVVQSTGDGIFAIFGAPVAHEDHPQRALYAALRMQEDLRRYSTNLVADGGNPLQCRVGVNTGEVVVRSISTGGKTEYTPIGHTANLASRMQAVAPVGSVAIAEATRNLCEGYFALRAIGPTKVKGVAEPVNVYEVTGLGPLRTRLQRSAGRGLSKFVGREREMEAMRTAAELARAGKGQIVSAIAEAGTGKSRLFFEFKAKNQSGWTVLEAFSVSHGKASAFFPVIDLLHGYFKITGDDDQRARRAKVTGNVLTLDRSLEDTLPYLFALLGISEADDPLESMDPQIRKRRTLDSIKRLLLRESLNQPLMVIFEDLHWIDSETQAFLNLLADSIGTAKLLLLVNYRPEYAHQWNNKTYYTQLRLDPLGKDSAEDMLASLLGDSAALAPLKRVIIDRTEGNPFFMEETVQVLLDEGALIREGSSARLTRPLSELKIPPTVQGILTARIDRLPADEKNLLQTLAVLGKEFPLSVVRQVAARRDDELSRMLEDLQLAEFVYEQPAVADTEYTFKHALTQEVAYNSVLSDRRRSIHEQAARAIEAIYVDHLDDHFGELARHYLLSNNADKALHYGQLAIEQAMARSAYEETGSLLEAALKLLDRLPDGPERLRAELALRNVESHLAFNRYGASSMQREVAVNRLCEIGEKLGEPDQVIRGLVNLVNLLFPRGEATQAYEVARRCLELARSVGDAALLADALWNLGIVAESCGYLSEAAASLKEALGLAEHLDHRLSIVGFMLSSAIRVHHAPSLLLLGRVDEAMSVAEDGLRRARDSRHIFSLGHALTLSAGWLGRIRYDPKLTRVRAEEVIALSEEHGLAEWLAWGHFSRGWALAELGQVEEGIREMEAGVAGFRQLGGVPRQQYAIACLARGYAKIEQTEKAVAMLEEALAQVERSGEKVDLVEMLRLKAEIVLIGDPSATAEAEQCLRSALEIASAQGAKWWQLRATTSLARLLRDTNRRDEARAILSEIYNWFTEGFDTADLKDAKALLDELGTSR